LANKINQLPAC